MAYLPFVEIFMIIYLFFLKNVQSLKLSIPTKLLYIGKINLSIYYQSIFFLLSLRICFWRYIF